MLRDASTSNCVLLTVGRQQRMIKNDVKRFTCSMLIFVYIVQLLWSPLYCTGSGSKLISFKILVKDEKIDCRFHRLWVGFLWISAIMRFSKSSGGSCESILVKDDTKDLRFHLRWVGTRWLRLRCLLISLARRRRTVGHVHSFSLLLAGVCSWNPFFRKLFRISMENVLDDVGGVGTISLLYFWWLVIPLRCCENNLER